ncbi:MAG TPA: ATP-binding protein [Candidatus Tectomicrobia bacterium]|nr:ATP-binding protein [Candidatus Tectomicrobia bacterium]
MRVINRPLIFLLVIILLFVGVNFLVTVAFVNQLTSSMLKKSAFLLADQIKLVVTTVLERDLSEFPFTGDEKFQRFLEAYKKGSELIRNVQIIDKDYTIRFSGDPTLIGEKYVGSSLREALGAAQPVVLEESWTKETVVYDVWMPLLQKDNPQGFIRVILHSPEVRKIYGSTQGRFMVLYGVVLSLVLATIVVMTKQLRTPIDWLAESLSLIAEGNFKSLRPYRRKDEFTPLFESLEKVSRVMQSVQETWHAGDSRLLGTDDVLEEGVVVLDRQMRLRFANPAAIAMLGTSSDRLFTQDWHMVLAGNGALRQSIEEVLQNGLLVQDRDVEVNAQERWLTLRLHGYPIPVDDGSIAAAILLLRDSARTRTLERDLVYASRFKAITELYIGITHDIKVPLHAVIMHLEMLRKVVDGESRGGEDKKAVRYIDSITQEIKRLDTIIRAFLDYASPFKNRVELVDVRQVVADCITLLEPEAARKHIGLHKEVPGEPLWVYGDEGKLKQALLNLAVNAFDAMPVGGSLTIRGAQHDGECLLEIQDTGQGIKDDEKAKIFRFHYSTKDSGSGVGLSIVKMITEYHGGRVEFESTEGKGSLFTLRFPKGREDGTENHHHR